MHLLWVQYFQILSLLLSIIYSKGLIKFNIHGFIPLLLIVVVTEFFGTNRAYWGWKNNYLLYDCYLIVSFPITLFVFYKMLLYKGIYQIVFWTLGMLLLGFFIVNLFFIEGRNFDSYTLILSEFAISFLSLMVLTKLFKDDDFDLLLYQHPYFWISGATLIFSVSVLVLLGMQLYIETQKIQIDGKNIYRVITPIMNVILYVSYSYAFFLCNKLTRKLLQQ